MSGTPIDPSLKMKAMKSMPFIAGHILLYYRQIPKVICVHPSGSGFMLRMVTDVVLLPDMPMYYTS